MRKSQTISWKSTISFSNKDSATNLTPLIIEVSLKAHYSSWPSNFLFICIQNIQFNYQGEKRCFDSTVLSSPSESHVPITIGYSFN